MNEGRFLVLRRGKNRESLQTMLLAEFFAPRTLHVSDLIILFLLLGTNPPTHY